jgi:HlyD family secretion protein
MAAAKPSAARRWAVRFLVLAALVGAGVMTVRLMPRKALAVRAVRPQVGTVRDVVSSSVAGEVTPELRAMVRADLAARVVAVLHKAGARVKKGEVIVRLDAADLDARLSQAQAAAAAAAGQVAQAQARRDTLARQAERARTLLARGAGTAQLAEDSEAAVREAGEAIRAASGQLQQAQAAVQVARVARGHAEIVAPFDGLLTEVLPNVGEVLAPAAPVLQIIDDSRLHVDATIDEADAAKVRPGQEAELKLDALPDQVVKGKVARVDPAVKRDLKGARTLGVEVEVRDVTEALKAGLKPGMSANVDIVVAEKQGVLYLPSNVIIGRGVSRAVLALRPDGRDHVAHKVEIKVGLSNWDRTEVISGLGADELVAASLNQKGLEDGARVKVELPKEGARGGAAP